MADGAGLVRRLSEGALRELLDARAARSPSWRLLTLAFLGGGMGYGAVMGTFGGLSGDRPWQVLFAALKVPLLLAATFVISLPCFCVLGSLLGLRRDLGPSLRALLRAQAGMTVVLASLAPFTVLFYVSSGDYEAALLFNALMFGVASAGGHRLLRGLFQPLVLRTPRHRWSLRIWITTYAFVGIQLGWVLRPFVGDPRTPVAFFREGAWGNAYVVVVRLIRSVLGL